VLEGVVEEMSQRLAPRAWLMSWRCGLGTLVVFLVAGHAVFLSSFLSTDITDDRRCDEGHEKEQIAF
jgi:hypothetical protein